MEKVAMSGPQSYTSAFSHVPFAFISFILNQIRFAPFYYAQLHFIPALFLS